MVDIKHLKSVYFLGIGGIGMSALARYFNHRKVSVAGYDRTPSALTRQLESEGIAIHYSDDTSKIPAAVDLCVFTPAVSSDLEEFGTISARKIPMLKRSEVLGLITDSGCAIAIAGTHGKTSTTSLTAHLLKTAEFQVNAFIGGISANYNSNILLADDSNLFIVEADEFDRSFLKLHPQSAVITSMDADHLDIYGDQAQLKHSFLGFSSQVSGFLLVKETIKAEFNHSNCFSYALDSETADYHAANISLVDGVYHFDLVTPKFEIQNLELGVGGLHNVENAVAASALALQQGVSEAWLKIGLRTFKGVQRRFEPVIVSQNLVYIDDYAHHPEEIKACLTSLREMYPNRRITAVFQPHLFTRTRDFADEFAAALSLADELLMLDIYPAREEPIEGITSQWLLDKVLLAEKQMVSKEGLVHVLSDLKPQLIVTMGAGDIDRLVKEIKDFFIQNYNQ